MSTITRPALCRNCEIRVYPRRGELYLVGNRETETFNLGVCKSSGVRGITPHFFTYCGVNSNGTLKIKRICVMNGCGVHIEHLHDNDFKVTVIEVDYIDMTPEQWNALVMLGNDPDFIP